MIQELSAANNHLGTALDGYIRACSAVENSLAVVSQEFLNLLDDELLRLSSYATKIAHAKASLQRMRNRASIIAPINTLPDEVLTRIF